MKKPKYLIDRYRVRVIITKPDASIQTLLPVRSLVHIPLSFPIKGGEILYKDREPYLLLATHHEHQLAKVCVGLHLNTTVKIDYFTEQLHPVTNLPSGKALDHTITIPAVLEVGSEVMDKELSAKRNIYYLGQPVSLDDLINDTRVRKVDFLNGIYRVEVY